MVIYTNAVPDFITNNISHQLIFFTASIFFTSAALCQLIESATNSKNHDLFPNEKRYKVFLNFFWYPKRIGYISSFIQLIGTFMFNINTGNALFILDDSWFLRDIIIWIPNIIGCICFLISSRMAFMEVCHSYFAIHIKDLEWWITTLNFLGSICFMVSALYGLALSPHLKSIAFIYLSTLFTILGAICFFISSYLLIPEIFSE